MRDHSVFFYILPENTKNRVISAAEWTISTKFGKLMQNVSSKYIAVKIFI